MRVLEPVPGTVPRRSAAEAYLRELAGELTRAVELYVVAAREASTVAERDHLTRQAARLREHVVTKP